MSDNLIKASAAAKQLGKSSTTIRREYTIVGECRHGLDAFFERYNIIEGNIVHAYSYSSVRTGR